jgi:KDO2-lipid IV(A) lauroyltransferase
VLVLLAVAAALACVPFLDLRELGVPLAWLVGSVLRIRRGQVEASMARAGLGGDSSLATSMYASLATGVMEILWLLGQGRADFEAIVTVDPASRALLDEALAPGCGVVLGASHTGNWELAACAMAQRAPLSVLVKRVSIGVFERFIWRLRQRHDVGLLEGEGALARASEELARGRVVALLIDQVPPREEHGDWLPFLGAPALTDRAPAVLAASAQVPLVVTASRRTDDGRHVLHVLSVKRPPRRGRAAWTRAAMREATEELDAFVRKYPDQWLWMHRRWKTPSMDARGGLVTPSGRR